MDLITPGVIKELFKGDIFSNRIQISRVTMVRIKTHKDNLLHRLKIARGQMTKLIEMIENDRYCIDVLHTSLSTQKALKKVDILLMEHHLRHCAMDQAKNGEIEKLIQELVSVYKYRQE